MKYFALCFTIVAFFAACGGSSQTSKSPLDSLTEEQKQKLDQRIPPEIREILDKAEEFTISYDVDKDTAKLKVLTRETVPNANANVADSNVKKEFLDSFYVAASTRSNGNGCYSPRQKLKAKYKTEVVEIDICYECGWFRGKSSSGNFGGTIEDGGESSAIMNAIIEKYGTKIK